MTGSGSGSAHASQKNKILKILAPALAPPTPAKKIKYWLRPKYQKYNFINCTLELKCQEIKIITPPQKLPNFNYI
jgi:hypothetical protein